MRDVLRWSIAAMRPTQVTVGFIEVARKVAEIRERDNHPREFDEWLASHAVPAVEGPDGAAFITDHHHLVRALYEVGHEEAYVRFDPLLSSKEGLSMETFLKMLDLARRLRPVDARGERVPLSRIPFHVMDLVDDPFRSLAGAVRDAGGYDKPDGIPFVEFAWADFLRKRLTPLALEEAFDEAVVFARKLARTRAAASLPGAKA